MSVKLEVVTESKQTVTEYHLTVQAAETALERLKRMFKVVKSSISRTVKHVELPAVKHVELTKKRYGSI